MQSMKTNFLHNCVVDLIFFGEWNQINPRVVGEAFSKLLREQK